MNKATPIIAPAEISCEQFCSQWIADVKAVFAPDETPTGRELRRETIAQLLRDALDNASAAHLRTASVSDRPG